MSAATGTHLANIARELRIVAGMLEEMRPKKVGVLDEIAERRAGRRTAAAGS